MSSTETRNQGETATRSAGTVDLKLEVVVIPVADVDHARSSTPAWAGGSTPTSPFDNGFRVVQLTPPGSGTSVQFGSNMTTAGPGSAQGLYLIVSDIEGCPRRPCRQGRRR